MAKDEPIYKKNRQLAPTPPVRLFDVTTLWGL